MRALIWRLGMALVVAGLLAGQTRPRPAEAVANGEPNPFNAVTTLDSQGLVGSQTDLAIGADGLAIISYHDISLRDLKAAHCGNTLCTSGNVTRTVDAGGEVGSYTSIAIGTDGLPIIAYRWLSFADFYAAHCNDVTCTTRTLSPLETEGNVGTYPSIAIGADGFPVVSYHDENLNQLRVAHCGSVTCQTGVTTATVDANGRVGSDTSIAIGADNLPVISYYDEDGQDLKVAHCGNSTCTSGNTLTSVDTTGDVGRYTSLVIGDDGRPIISYYAQFDKTNTGQLKVVHCGNAACSAGNTITTVDDAGGTGDVGATTSIAIGTDSRPIISYLDFGNQTLKVAHCINLDCTGASTITTVAFGPGDGGYSSIAIGTDGLPIISFQGGDQDLKVLHCAYQDCGLPDLIREVFVPLIAR